MTSSWMLVAGLFFAGASIFVKLGSQDFGAAELAFYRSAFTLLATIGVVYQQRGTVLTPHFGMHLVRGIMGATSLIGYFYAITQLPLATAITLNYTAPLFLAVTTTLVMRERFSPLLVVAIFVGFGGVTMLLQPNFEEGKDGPALIGLLSGVIAAWAYLSIRTMGRLGEPDWRIVFWFSALSVIICGGWQLAAAGGFHAVTAGNWWILAGLGACGFFAQMAMTRAYRTGNALVAGALSYSTIVFGTVATIFLWDERLSGFEWAGMAVIIAAGLLALRAERRSR
jgi:drug/metabolite transporter (DMT)-like permease